MNPLDYFDPRAKRPKPQLRAYYGDHITELLEIIPASFALKSKHHADMINFLAKFGAYLASEDYARKSEKMAANKARCMAKKVGK